MIQANVRDGLLEAVIIPQDEEKKASLWRRRTPKKGTHIRFSRGTIVSKEPMQAHVDNHAVSGFSFEVTIVPKKLRFITGRGRRRVSVVNGGLPRRSRTTGLAKDQEK